MGRRPFKPGSRMTVEWTKRGCTGIKPGMKLPLTVGYFISHNRSQQTLFFTTNLPSSYFYSSQRPGKYFTNHFMWYMALRSRLKRVGLTSGQLLFLAVYHHRRNYNLQLWRPMSDGHVNQSIAVWQFKSVPSATPEG